ncbi:MAG: DUF3987 domain-containing protein [Prevotella sp.]|nr:DUF3987 domain-containing protein [Prevotella sp.]
MAFGIALSVKSRVRECTPALLSMALDSGQTGRVCAEIEDALESVRRGEMSREDFETFKGERKRQLAILTPHATFPSGRRRNEEAVPSGLSMYDIDHISDPRGYFASMVADRVSELGIVFAHITPSTEGLRLVFVVPDGMSLEEAQRWMSGQLGDDHYDDCVKDWARCSFVVPRDYVLYLDEEELFAERGIDVSVVKKLEEDSSVASSANVTADATDESNGLTTPNYSNSLTSNGKPKAFKNLPYAEIIAEYWRRTGGEPTEGERNKRLHQLAANLRAICDNSEEWLLEVMPSYGLSAQEMRSIVHSACKEPTKGSRIIDQIVKALEQGRPSDEIENDEESPEDSAGMSMRLGALPVGLRESLAGVPAAMRMPVLCAVLPIAAAYADQVEVDYCDGNRQRLGLMSIIRGDQASGKSVCKNAVDVWKRQLEEEDALARKREEEWKERKKARKANEKAPDDPKVLIRMVPVTVSCSTLLKRFKNANGHTLYSFGEELDTLRKTNGAGSWSSKYDIYRLSFDNGEWGQDYNSDAAESGVVKVAYNWTLLGTNGALRKCFKADNIENGLSSRILVAEMPDSSFAKMPRFGRRSVNDEARIQEAVSRLRSCSGFVDTPRLRKAVEEWVEQKRVEAAKDIDHVKDTYRKRAAVIGFRCGVIFHLLTGKERETKQCLDFALMMADYCLEQQISTFGEALLNQYVDASNECRRYGANHSVFDQLPPIFTIGDLRALKHGYCGESALRTIITRWRRDGWIEKTDARHWQKKSAEESPGMSHCHNATLLH